MITYKVAIRNTSQYFPVEFQIKENAKIFCDYLSKRDQRIDYYVMGTIYEIGLPDYQDEKVLLELSFLNNK